ncbi:2-phosphosulfolactate phosphatase [Butyrivibrio sp. MC2013]|uniref:2-phosphosulfolactate phosphatase n=1 Tax=Butyrivibrio sp. MC2013 TaxID=1280686 RepID=UPI000428181A|nr:2-phosphosulfolactate phosphatase [Butyrivibrio sp. MC2013]
MKFQGTINTYSLIEGAQKATGLTVIIDVFRAFSLEAYLYSMGARQIRPTGSLEETYAWRDRDPDCLLIGERQGKMCEGFDYGNSPSTVDPERIRGSLIIHTSSAGVQGVNSAVRAERIITGSLVNAAAVAAYIKREAPDEVSLVCMGNGGVAPAREDELCASYIRSMLLDEDMPDLDDKIRDLRYNGGEHFFDPALQEIFPKEDFYMCTKRDLFNFIIRIEKDDKGLISVMEQ